MAIEQRVLVAANAAELIAKRLDTLAAMGAQYSMHDKQLHDILPKVGNGSYGVVFKLPDNNILKVCNDPKDAYPAYAQWCKLNPQNHVPDIYFAQRLTSGVFVCAMPAYENISSDTQRAQIERLRDKGLHGEPTAALSIVIQRMEEVFSGVACRDMHSGNFMYCPTTGYVVVTDPYAGCLNAMTGLQVESMITGRCVIDCDQMDEQLHLQLKPAGTAKFEVLYAQDGRAVPQGVVDFINNKQWPSRCEYFYFDDYSDDAAQDTCHWVDKEESAFTDNIGKNGLINDYPGWHFVLRYTPEQM